MRTLLVALSLFLVVPGLSAQEPTASPSLDFVCPMDADVRAAQPGRCPRCGMALRIGVPEALEYPVQLTLEPRIVRPNRPVDLRFRVRDPKSGAPVRQFEVIHEKLFHLFIVSEDLDHFEHGHPILRGDHTFRHKTKLPKPGMYRLLSDFYPKGGTPQLVEQTLLVSGPASKSTAPELTADLSEKRGDNVDVELIMEPEIPIAGMKTLMFFRIKPADGLEQYLGAWGHMLTVSDDLLDTIHNHPFLADGGPQVQFNLVFPRARTYRVWVQFQRKGIVNTIAFTIPVSTLK